jgi:glyoxylase-like metal-dependent hydrolase (beta-lactamase superfamily II)
VIATHLDLDHAGGLGDFPRAEANHVQIFCSHDPIELAHFS